MPRMEPPHGYVTATQATKILNVSTAMLAKYAHEGKIERMIPEGYTKVGFYKKADVDKMARERGTLPAQAGK